MKTLVASVAATGAIASVTAADFIGWTANSRAVTGGFLINVYAVTNNSTDVILFVYGGLAGTPSAGTITSNAVGGFKQGTLAQSIWAPSGSQNWTTLDSFLTIGGSLTSSNAWTAFSTTVGDSPWNVTYFDTATEEKLTVNAFNTQSNADGFTNPYSSTIPATGGFFIAGASSPARSLASLTNRVASSNAAAAAGTFGMMVGQFYVANAATEAVKFTNMGATLKRSNGSLSQAAFNLTVNLVDVDADGDGVPNAADPCPTVPGPCGGCPLNACGACGTADDSDADAVPNCVDNCPTVPGPCGGCPLNACGACGTAADSDADGVPNCVDNCPTVANPLQQDCDSDGQGNACENGTDCNGNGLPDSCDIASGFSVDVNSNGVPDSCESDCNDNDLPDAYEIALGSLPDCNGNGVPDTCGEGAVGCSFSSGNLGAPSGDEVRSFVIDEAPVALAAVRFTVDVRGDLNGVTEYIEVAVGSLEPRRFFQANGSSCPATPDRATFVLPAAEFNAARGTSGDVTISVVCPVTVDPTECKGSGLTAISVEYFGIGPTADCNANDVLDSCDIATGVAVDCNENGTPDACESPQDCDSNGIPDICDLFSGSGADCNANGLLDSCDIASGASVDIDGNGKPDECQTVTVPGSFATIQAAIDAAPTDEMRIVHLAAGTYPGPVAFNGKPIVLRGVSAAQTAIEGNAGQQVSVVRFTGGEPGIAALERVTVRGGTSGTVLPGTSFFLGGGVFGNNSQAKIRQCVIENNASAFGGGVYLLNCTTVISNTTIRANNANSDGGGLQLSQGAVNVIDTVIENNSCNARGGGAHLVQGTPILTRVTVRDNVSNNLIGGVSWFAIGAPGAILRMESCTVTGNSALVTQGGIGISETLSLPPTVTLVGTNACANLPRPNVAGRWIDGGANVVCDCAGDLNADGLVNGVDLGVMLGQWGVCAGSSCVGDLDGDGTVNGADLGLLLGDWGGCG